MFSHTLSLAIGAISTWHLFTRVLLVFVASLSLAKTIWGEEALIPAKPERSIRVATFNTAFSRDQAGELLKELQRESEQAKRIAGILRTVRPDIVLLNEFDYSADNAAIDLFLAKYLESPSGLGEPIRYRTYFTAPVNTGEPSGLDLDRNGKRDDPNDAFGYGRYPGHYGMVLLSMFPIEKESARTFQKLLWHTLPNADRPMDPTNQQSYYDDETWKQLRLSSKSHWDIPVHTPQGILHLLCSHPTPPAFDGPEDRNGRRNHDEIRLWKEYIENPKAAFLIDDQERKGGLPTDSSFVILGDLNADPMDGDDQGKAIRLLLESPQIRATPTPVGSGGKEAAILQGQKNKTHRGNPEEDTSDFNDRGPGNLRVDYVLPSTTLQPVQTGVFWPKREQIESIDPGWLEASDHRLVWIDIMRNSN